MSSLKPKSIKLSDELIISLVQQHFTEKTTKVTTRDVTPSVLAEIMRIFISETATRAAQQAHDDGASVCEVDHVEKILPQLLLDF